MHAVELVDLAGLVASQAGLFIHTGKPLPERALEEYWSASKCRLDRWGLELMRLKDSRVGIVEVGGDNRRQFASLIEEILTGELLARVWTGVLAAVDRSQGSTEAEPIGRSVLAGQMEARNRALKLISGTRSVWLSELVGLDRLRRTSERWTDLLLAQLLPLADMHDFSHDPDRLDDFAVNQRLGESPDVSRMRWSLLLASLRAAFHRDLNIADRLPSPNRDLNRRIGESILSCWRPEQFDAVGPLRSVWQSRLMRISDDTEALIDSLLEPSLPADASARPNGTRRRF